VAFGEAFKEGAAGIHDRNYRRRQALAKDQSRRHRQRRDDIKTNLSTRKAAQDFDHQGHQNGNDPGEPEATGDLRLATNMQRKTRSKSRQRYGEQECLEPIGLCLLQVPFSDSRDIVAPSPNKGDQPA
jgi:hypothetical protein